MWLLRSCIWHSTAQHELSVSTCLAQRLRLDGDEVQNSLCAILSAYVKVQLVKIISHASILMLVIAHCVACRVSCSKICYVFEDIFHQTVFTLIWTQLPWKTTKYKNKYSAKKWLKCPHVLAVRLCTKCTPSSVLVREQRPFHCKNVGTTRLCKPITFSTSRLLTALHAVSYPGWVEEIPLVNLYNDIRRIPTFPPPAQLSSFVTTKVLR